MQLLKSMSVLSLTAVLIVAVWAIWNLPNDSKADPGASAESVQKQLQDILDRKPEPLWFAMDSSEFSLGLAALSVPEGKLEIFLSDKSGSQTVIHELRYALTGEPLPKGEGTDPSQPSASPAGNSVSNPPQSGSASQILSVTYKMHAQGQPPSEISASWNISQGPQGPTLSAMRGGPLPFLSTAAPQTSSAATAQIKGTTPSDANPSSSLAVDVTAFPWPTPGVMDAKKEGWVLDPFSARLVATRSAAFKIQGRLPVTFRALTRNEAAKAVETFGSQPLALDLLTPSALRSNDTTLLITTSQKCISTTQQFGERMLRSLPNVPYLLHRKANLLQTLCRGTLTFGEAALDQKPEAQSRDRLNEIMNTRVRAVFKAQVRELPRSIVTSPSWTIIFDDQQPHLWINALRELVEQSINEIDETVVFEAERKVPVKMQVVLRGRTMGTVVKGVIKHKKLEISTHIQASPNATLLPESLTEISKAQLSTAAAGKLPMLNGHALLNDPSLWEALPELCAASQGALGLDLGDLPDGESEPQPPQAKPLWVVWEEHAQIEVLDLFLRRGMGARACKDFTIRVSNKLKARTEEHVASFDSEVVQAKQEIQLTNSRFRYLNLVPGTYEIFVNSLITGKMLERFDFTVTRDKKNQNISLTVGKNGDVLPETPSETD